MIKSFYFDKKIDFLLFSIVKYTGVDFNIQISNTDLLISIPTKFKLVFITLNLQIKKWTQLHNNGLKSRISI